MKLLSPLKLETLVKNRIMFHLQQDEKMDLSANRVFVSMSALQKVGVESYCHWRRCSYLSTFSPAPKLYSPQQAEGFQRLADTCVINTVQSFGIQLFHPDYNVAALNEMFHQGKMQEARAKLHP